MIEPKKKVQDDTEENFPVKAFCVCTTLTFFLFYFTTTISMTSINEFSFAMQFCDSKFKSFLQTVPTLDDHNIVIKDVRTYNMQHESVAYVVSTDGLVYLL